MIQRIRERYPHAMIICGTLVQGRIRNQPDWTFPRRYAGVDFEEYNEAIRRCCRQNNCRLADLAATGIHFETLDGSHPTAQGHREFAQAWKICSKDLQA